MINEFLKIKTNRSVWTSLLLKNDIEKGIAYYEKYISLLKSILEHCEDSNKNIVNNEIETSQKNFKLTLYKKGKENYKRKNYTLACLCFAGLIKLNEIQDDIIPKYINCLFELNQNDIGEEFLRNYIKTINDDIKTTKFEDLNKLYLHIHKKSGIKKSAFISIFYDVGYKNHSKFQVSHNLYDIKNAFKFYKILYNILFFEDFWEKFSFLTDLPYKIFKNKFLSFLCKFLISENNTKFIYKKLIDIFYNAGMLNEQAYCYEMLFRTFDNNGSETKIIDYIDKFRCLAQIFVYFSINNDLSSVLKNCKHLKLLEEKIKTSDEFQDDIHRKELNEIKEYLAKELCKNEHNKEINTLAIELNPNCEQAYINLINTEIQNHQYQKAYISYIKYCSQFNMTVAETIPQMLWELSEIYMQKQLDYKSVQYQQLAIEYELSTEGKP